MELSSCWTAGCSGSSNEELVSNLVTAGMITHENIHDAMVKTDRAKYCCDVGRDDVSLRKQSPRYRYGPYADAPQSLGNKVTISAPFIHAIELETLVEKISCENSRILDVGCGSGILLSYMKRIAPKSTTIIGIEILEDLVTQCCTNLRYDGYSVKEIKEKCYSPNQSECKSSQLLVSEPSNTDMQNDIIVIHGNGWFGAADFGPYDAINVGASASAVSQELLNQLKVDGFLLMPIGEKVQGAQMLTKFIKRQRPDKSYFIEEVPIRSVRFVPLINAPVGSNVSANIPLIDWDSRYKKGWAYGSEPNAFLVGAMQTYSGNIQRKQGADTVQSKCISLGEGQGRNSVYLSSQGLHCTAVDRSVVGLAKAKQLAERKGVEINHAEVVADLTEYDFESEQYDLIVSIFCMLPPSQRHQLHSKCAAALKEGGSIIIQCFSPRQLELRTQHTPDKQWSLGPSIDCLVSWEELSEDFRDLEILHAKEKEANLSEGTFHRGRAVLTEFVARKPVVARSVTDLRSDSFCSAIDDVFQYFLCENQSRSICGASKLSSDCLLQNAEKLLQMACSESQKRSWCRYCWCSSIDCICKEIERKLAEIEANDCPNAQQSIHWVMVVHPIEFLRSTSSVKIASRIFTRMKGMSSELLIYGYYKHEQRLDAILQDAATSNRNPRQSTVLLFPEEEPPSEATGSNECYALHLNNRPRASSAVETDPVESSSVVECRLLKSVSIEESRMTVIVPDGSWENARAIWKEIRKKVSKEIVPNYTLKQDLVDQHFSPLIESLKGGQGMGRISTLEACAIFMQETGQSAHLVEQMLDGLSPLVEFVQSSIQNKANELFLNHKNDAGLKQWTEAIQKVAQHLPIASTSTPIGLRKCPICCENLATPHRMQQHIRGKRHCALVAYSFIKSNPSLANNQIPPTDDIVSEVFLRFSTEIIATAVAEPPDFALAALKIAEGHQSLPRSKGERALQAAALPQVEADLPDILRRNSVLQFDKSFGFYRIVSELLQSAITIGHFRESKHKPLSSSNISETLCLEDFIPSKDIFRNFKERQVLYSLVSKHQSLLEAYERLVKEICCPFLKNSLLQSNEISDDLEIHFHYQYPPSLRLQEGPSEEHGRPHRDLEYGHQVGEVNFWLPLTDYKLTSTTLWVESSPRAADYQPLELDYGQIAAFHGSLCHHFAPKNTSEFTRVSLDFRIGVGKYFDPVWELPSARGKHPRRLFVL